MTYEREKEMRNLTPDDKRIEESQQLTARETTEGERVDVGDRRQSRGFLS